MVDQKIKQTLKVAAGMGKGDDKYVGHLAHGEIILSNAFQKEYPGLIDDLRKAFERVGINMNRYIVGHKENRINSETGMPMYAEGMDGAGEGPGGGGGYGDGDSVGGNGSGADAGGGNGGGGEGGSHDRAITTDTAGDTPAPATTTQIQPAKIPVVPLTPENTGVKLGYDPIGPASFSPATPTAMNNMAAPAAANADPSAQQVAPFSSGSTIFQPGQQPAFADGGIVDAALKKVSSKYSDTGLPLNAMQILSKIARTG